MPHNRGELRLQRLAPLRDLMGDREVREENYHRIERWSGNFDRHIDLPIPVQADRVRATYRDGILQIRLPKIEEIKPKEIKIELG